MVNLGLAGFFAVGAYASALLTTAGHAPIAAGWLLALVAGGAAGLVVTLSTTRLREDYLAIVTLGFAEVVRLVAANEIWLTRGTDGISGIPGPWKAALGPDLQRGLFPDRAGGAGRRVLRRCAASTARPTAARCAPSARTPRWRRSPASRCCASRPRPSRCRPPSPGLAGALYGHFTSYIAPDLFLPLITVYIFLAVASGGTGARPARWSAPIC